VIASFCVTKPNSISLIFPEKKSTPYQSSNNQILLELNSANLSLLLLSAAEVIQHKYLLLVQVLNLLIYLAL